MSKNRKAPDNPCEKEQKMSFDCLNKNNYDREKCEEFFVNYNYCRAFWNRIRETRKAKGIVPHMPEQEERARIKAEYMKTKPD